MTIHETLFPAALTTKRVNSAMANWFMLCWKISGVRCEGVKRNLRCGLNGEFLNATTAGAYSYHCVLSDQSSLSFIL